MEVCPSCQDITLEFDPGKGRPPSARCLKCGWSESVQDERDYEKKFVLVARNWTNYCAQTPTFVRKIRKHTSLEDAIKNS